MKRKKAVATKKSYKGLIIGASIIIPLAVALIYFGPTLKLNVDLSFLPQFHAIINALTFMMLLLGLFAIRNEIVFMHRRFMTAALLLSVVFLLSYILYHSTHEPTSFGGEGFVKGVYYFLLTSHIILAAAIVPLVLITYVRALSEKFDKHRKIAKITLPIWMYVCLTGVIVYYMLEPYY